MEVGIDEKRFNNRLFNVLIVFLGLFSILPILISFSYQYFMKLKGVTVHEGNSGIFSLFWLAFLTIPLGVILLILFAIIKDRYNKKN